MKDDTTLPLKAHAAMRGRAASKTGAARKGRAASKGPVKEGAKTKATPAVTPVLDAAITVRAHSLNSSGKAPNTSGPASVATAPRGAAPVLAAVRAAIRAARAAIAAGWAPTANRVAMRDAARK